MQFLGMCFAFGDGVTADPAEAAAWFRKAAEAGNAGGMLNLGTCYGRGAGVERDEDQALAWMRKAAEAGSEPAKAVLASREQEGDGTAMGPDWVGRSSSGNPAATPARDSVRTAPGVPRARLSPPPG